MSDFEASARDAARVRALHRERHITKLLQQKSALEAFLQKPEHVAYRARLKAKAEMETAEKALLDAEEKEARDLHAQMLEMGHMQASMRRMSQAEMGL